MHLVLDSNDRIPPNCTSIELKDFSKLVFLCTFLQDNATVKEVILWNNQIGDEGAKALFEVLKVNCTITKLSLCGNRIGDDSAKALAEALKVNCTITKLSVFKNRIGDEGAKAIAKALKVNRTITALDLSHNKIGNEGAKAIAEALKVNCTITELYSNANDQIGIKVLITIAVELTANRFIYEELKQVSVDAQCKTMTLGLFQTVPIYVLLDIFELVVVLDLEHKTNSHKFYNNNSFSKLLEKNVSKKRLLNNLDKITLLNYSK